MTTKIIELTPEQQALIAPLMDEIAAMATAGKPGILAAQVFPDHIKVGVISNEHAREMILKSGGDPEARIRSAY
jgi:hypothetical protein